MFLASDDGFLYALRLADGKPLWKKRGGPNDERVLGNERLISHWPARGGPVVMDDTVYFLPCASEEEARAKAGLLGSEAAADFFSAFLFWDAKRPITAQLLNRLDLVTLAKEQ